MSGKTYRIIDEYDNVIMTGTSKAVSKQLGICRQSVSRSALFGHWIGGKYKIEYVLEENNEYIQHMARQLLMHGNTICQHKNIDKALEGLKEYGINKVNCRLVSTKKGIKDKDSYYVLEVPSGLQIIQE